MEEWLYEEKDTHFALLLVCLGGSWGFLFFVLFCLMLARSFAGFCCVCFCLLSLSVIVSSAIQRKFPLSLILVYRDAAGCSIVVVAVVVVVE